MSFPTSLLRFANSYSDLKAQLKHHLLIGVTSLARCSESTPSFSMPRHPSHCLRNTGFSSGFSSKQCFSRVVEADKRNRKVIIALLEVTSRKASGQPLSPNWSCFRQAVCQVNPSFSPRGTLVQSPLPKESFC